MEEPGQPGGGRERDELVAAAVVAGSTYAAIGQLIGRSARTVRNIAAKPEVQRAIAEGRREQGAAITGRLGGLLDDAVAAIERGLQDPSPAVNLRAAAAAFLHYFRCTSETTLREEVQALHDQLHDLRADRDENGELE